MVKTDNWRIFKPILDKDKCVKCFEVLDINLEAIFWSNKDNSVDIEYYYCNGFGICSNVCLIKAIRMEREN